VTARATGDDAPEAEGAPMLVRCPVGCNSALQTSRIRLPEGPLLRCTECGQLLSQCTEAAYVAALTKWDTTHGTRPDERSVARHAQVSRRRVAALLRLLGRPAAGTRLLDVGCSSGAFLASAAAAGLAVEGVEPSPEAAESARRAGFKVFTGLLEDARYPDACFDLVTLVEVLEHLADPGALLAECRRILRPGGIVLVTTPNADSWTARALGGDWEVFSLTGMGGHVSFFNPRSLQLLAGRAGFDTLKVETRHVRLAEKGRDSPLVVKLSKVAAGLLDAPARIAGKGHDLAGYLRRREAPG
jgi:SAM-dependent methyltransferase